MFCDIESYLCTINFGAMTLVLILLLVGISATLYGAIEDIQRWWSNRKDRGDKNL